MSNNIETHENGDHESPTRRRHGMLIVVSSPSGGGKGTLIRRVLKDVPDVGYSVSFTTRTPRKGEVDGREYFFVSLDVFNKMVKDGAFLEMAYVHGTLYGTAKAQVEREVAEGRDVILEIDVQGAENVRRDNKNAVMVFVLPPSFEILTQRLKARGSELPQDLAIRLGNARHEVESYRKFDYVIVNEDVATAADELGSIIKAERARRSRQDEVANAILSTFVPQPTSHEES